MSDTQPPSIMKVLVPDQEISQITVEGQPLEPGELHEQAAFGFVRRWFAKDHDIDLAKAKTELQRVETEVDELLGTLAAKRKGGYRLSEVQVAVGVSAQGSIGVVTAGVQASLTLIYSRPNAD
jgi:hypothetical protein